MPIQIQIVANIKYKIIFCSLKRIWLTVLLSPFAKIILLWQFSGFLFTTCVMAQHKSEWSLYFILFLLATTVINLHSICSALSTVGYHWFLFQISEERKSKCSQQRREREITVGHPGSPIFGPDIWNNKIKVFPAKKRERSPCWAPHFCTRYLK